MTIIPVSHVDEVLRNALVTEPVPIEWHEDDAVEAGKVAGAPGGEDEEVKGIRPH